MGFSTSDYLEERPVLKIIYRGILCILGLICIYMELKYVHKSNNDSFKITQNCLSIHWKSVASIIFYFLFTFVSTLIISLQTSNTGFNVHACRALAFGGGTFLFIAKLAHFFVFLSRLYLVYQDTAFQYSAKFVQFWKAFICIGFTCGYILVLSTTKIRFGKINEENLSDNDGWLSGSTKFTCKVIYHDSSLTVAGVTETVISVFLFYLFVKPLIMFRMKLMSFKDVDGDIGETHAAGSPSRVRGLSAVDREKSERVDKFVNRAIKQTNLVISSLVIAILAYLVSALWNLNEILFMDAFISSLCLVLLHSGYTWIYSRICVPCDMMGHWVAKTERIALMNGLQLRVAMGVRDLGKSTRNVMDRGRGGTSTEEMVPVGNSSPA